MAKNQEFGLAGKLALTITLLGCLVVIVAGVWLSRFSLFDPAPLLPICTFQSGDGGEYTVYRSDGGTTVGSSVGVYRGRDIDSANFHRWAYASGDSYHVGRSGTFLVIIATSAGAKYNYADTVVFDLGAQSDQWIPAKVLTQPITPLCTQTAE